MQLGATNRWLLAMAMVLIDLAIFTVPLTGLTAAYVLVVRPPWFRTWVDRLYAAP